MNMTYISPIIRNGDIYKKKKFVYLFYFLASLLKQSSLIWMFEMQYAVTIN